MLVGYKTKVKIGHFRRFIKQISKMWLFDIESPIFKGFFGPFTLNADFFYFKEKRNYVNISKSYIGFNRGVCRGWPEKGLRDNQVKN